VVFRLFVEIGDLIGDHLVRKSSSLVLAIFLFIGCVIAVVAILFLPDL